VASEARIVAVVGPSGVGKDSVIRGLVEADPRLIWLRRVVTRPADPTEPFAPADEAAFDAMEVRDAFSLSWRAHGLRYGVPQSEIAALDADRTGLVNLSRAVLGRAVAVWPRLSVLSVTAPAEVLEGRLAARGREDAAEIAARLSRPVPAIPEGLPVLTLDNGGPLAASVAAARAWLGQSCE
jgi:ribose 1,5-bisphosphokinase